MSKMKTIKLIKSEIHHLKNLLQMDNECAYEIEYNLKKSNEYSGRKDKLDSHTKMRIRMAKKIIEKLS